MQGICPGELLLKCRKKNKRQRHRKSHKQTAEVQKYDPVSVTEEHHSRKSINVAQQ